MSNFKKSFVLIFICIAFLFSQKADAGTASKVVDKSINYTGKAAYYVTKYTLKAGWFVIKKTAKGAAVISKSMFAGTKDAFKPSSKAKPVVKTDKKPDSVYTLPSNPQLYTLPPVPKID